MSTRALLAARAGMIAWVAVLAACAQPLSNHEPTMQSLNILRGSALPAMQVGDFALAPGKPASLDKYVTLRDISLNSPDDGSFAKYLGKTIETDLRAAGKLDPKSPYVIKGLLTDSDSGAPIGGASGTLSAKFSLVKDDRVIFEKDLSVAAQWDSSFIGVVAVPEAIRQYSALYEKLVSELFADKDFVAAATTN